MEMAVIEKHFYDICTYFLIENDKKETFVGGFSYGCLHLLIKFTKHPKSVMSLILISSAHFLAKKVKDICMTLVAAVFFHYTLSEEEICFRQCNAIPDFKEP